MKLFHDVQMRTDQKSRSQFTFIPEAAPPAITAAAFSGWPPHMRTEFALLARERRLKRDDIALATGIATGDLATVVSQKHYFALPQVGGHYFDEDRPFGRQADPASS